MILLREPDITHAEALTPATALVIDNKVVEGLTDGLDPRSVDTSKPPQHCNLVVAKWPIHVSTLADATQERVRWPHCPQAAAVSAHSVIEKVASIAA